MIALVVLYDDDDDDDDQHLLPLRYPQLLSQNAVLPRHSHDLVSRSDGIGIGARAGD